MKLPIKYDNLTPDIKKVVRLEYIIQQEGKCYYCKGNLNEQPPKKVRDMRIKPQLYPQGFFKHPVHLHHDHNTGLTLGAVHNYCNAILWEYYGE